MSSQPGASMPGDGLASSGSAVRSTLEHAALSLAQQQRLDRLRQRHRGIEPLQTGPGGTLQATVRLNDGQQHIVLEDPDKLLDRIEDVIAADQDGP